MGSAIIQQRRPVAYFSKTLTGAQMNYTTMEKELLAIVTTLKEFRSTLLGADITVYTDNKNLTFENLQTQRVIRWRLYLEKFGPKLVYFKGETKNLPIYSPDWEGKRMFLPLWGRMMPLSVTSRLNDAPSSDIKNESLDSLYPILMNQN